MSSNSHKKNIIEYICIIFGSAIYAFSTVLFIFPNGLLQNKRFTVKLRPMRAFLCFYRSFLMQFFRKTSRQILSHTYKKRRSRDTSSFFMSNSQEVDYNVTK